jgi:hypothetical protein
LKKNRQEPSGFLLVFIQGNMDLVLDEELKERSMKGVLAVVLGTMGYIMIGVALAGIG